MDSESLLFLIKKRRSRRNFIDKDVPESILLKLIEAAHWAPSAGHTQPLRVIIIKNPRIKEELAQVAYQQQSLIKAPVILVMCGDYQKVQARYGERGKNLYVIQDIAAATQNLLLMAEALGLGAVWVGAFNENEVTRILRLPRHVLPFALIPLGYSKSNPSPPVKRELHEIIFKEYYS